MSRHKDKCIEVEEMLAFSQRHQRMSPIPSQKFHILYGQLEARLILHVAGFEMKHREKVEFKDTASIMQKHCHDISLVLGKPCTSKWCTAASPYAAAAAAGCAAAPARSMAKVASMTPSAQQLQDPVFIMGQAGFQVGAVVQEKGGGDRRFFKIVGISMFLVPMDVSLEVMLRSKNI